MFTALWNKPADRVRWWLCGAGLVLLALVVGAPAIDRIPLESHEIFVVQSTREMAARGDWLTPWFNGQPRLNKPPFNYWATGAVAALDGSLPVAEAWHARAVSVAAGAGMVLLTLWLGVVLFDRATAGLAALLLVSSAGLFTYTHNARPDMLYAFFVTALLASAIAALRRVAAAGGAGNSQATVWHYAALAWLGFAAATLTKGPHVPAMALLGVAIAGWRESGGWRPVLGGLHLGKGLACVLLACGSWWLWLRLQLDRETLGGSQLGGSLLMPSLAKLGDPYYFYRPLQLLAPWLPLVLGSAAMFALPAVRRDTSWLWWPLLATCLVLSLGRQYRYFYLLPMLTPLCLLLARGLVMGLKADGARWVRPALWLALGLQLVVTLAAAGWVLVKSGRAGWLTPTVLGLGAGLGLAAATFLALRRRDVRYALLAAMGLVTASLWPGAALNGVLWAKERYESARLASEVARVAGADLPVATFGLPPTLYVHATNRRVRRFEHPERLAAQRERSPGGQWVLVVSSDRMKELPGGLPWRELDRTRHGGREEVLLLVGATAP